MNSDRIKGQWKQLKGKIKTKWGKLTDDDLDVIAGQKDQLIGKIQERYGIQKEEAQRQVDEWNKTLAEEDSVEHELRTAS
ncbi:MAG TPA: CsbD family protein [Terriglobales bacterium]|nr:CsbD family protein [Terriglobales bacterium]